MTQLQGPIITLTSDFGYSDPYVGMMKGAILSVFDKAVLVDISHNIAPQDITAAALLLEYIPDFFPHGTVHLVVVDPGVGSSRLGIAAKSGRGDFFVGPDNGVFSYHLERVGLEAAWQLSGSTPEVRSTISNTFHGRDLFSPVAAYLASGNPPELLGAKLTELIYLDRVGVHDKGTIIEIPIIHKDIFGNLITSLSETVLERVLTESNSFTFKIAGVSLSKISKTYSEVEPGQLLVLRDSNGRIEIAVNGGNAAVETGLSLGDTITLLLPGRKK